ncbi:MAG TPA: DUF3892 domain-containing protein [Solirubrobacteraceae bacterium]|jgi:hypothetical protein|nr:DUF3892 domain-containing protein [Solirubrobacteraceae bacterium]
MAEHLVIGVRKVASDDATHRHISEVCTAGPIRYTRQEVIDSIRQGDSWKTLANAHSAEIRIVDACPHDGCTLSPYIAANPDSTAIDNLENLAPG